MSTPTDPNKQAADSLQAAGSAPSKTVERRVFWAYLSENGEILTSTIRQKGGDCDGALRTTDQKYRGDPSKCRLVRVTVEWEAQNGALNGEGRNA